MAQLPTPERQILVLGPLRIGVSHLCSAKAPELHSVTLETEAQGRDCDETTTSTSSRFSGALLPQREAQMGKQMVTILKRPGFKWEAKR